MVTRRRLLILSFSRIESDARVLKQVRAFADLYDVVTCGFGESPDPRVTHVTIPDVPPKARRANLLLRRYSRLYAEETTVRGARDALAGQARFDVVLADDVEAVGLALELAPRNGVHADLHEYAPRLNEELLTWRLLIAPYKRWMCRTFLPSASSITTVGRGIADEYLRRYGVRSEVVTNAAPYVALDAHPVGARIRLVHSGATLRNRRLDVTVRAVVESSADVTLDLFLVPNDPAHLAELKQLAAGDERVTFHDPVPYAELIETLNGYDVGVHVIPPTNFNNRWALPNKLFDYVQARLGVLVGPTAEMAQIVVEHGIGTVADGFEVADVRRAIEAMTLAKVQEWKAQSDSSAHALSAEPQVAVWVEAIAELMATRR